MATDETPNNEMTTEIKKGDEIEVSLHDNTSIEVTEPTNEDLPPVSDTGTGQETTTTTEQTLLEASTDPIPEQHLLVQEQHTEDTNHEVPTDVDTSAMIAEAGKWTQNEDTITTQHTFNAAPFLSRL